MKSASITHLRPLPPSGLAIIIDLYFRVFSTFSDKMQKIYHLRHQNGRNFSALEDRWDLEKDETTYTNSDA